MFFALSILFITIFLLDLEIVVCTIIIKYFIVSVFQEETVLINFGLNKIAFFCEDRKRTVDIMKLIGWCPQSVSIVYLRLFFRRSKMKLHLEGRRFSRLRIRITKPRSGRKGIKTS